MRHSKTTVIVAALVAFTFLGGSKRTAGAQPTQAQYDSLAARVAKLEQLVARLAPAGRIVDGDLVVNGKVCIGRACQGDVPAQLQIAGSEGAEILFMSNLSGRDPQGKGTHASMLSADSDGGFRLVHNSYHRARPEWLVWQDSAKPRTVLGFDSMGTPSISQDYDGVIHPSQSLIFNFDRNARTAWIQSMKAGWKIGFCVSPRADNNCEGSYWTVPTP